MSVPMDEDVGDPEGAGGLDDAGMAVKFVLHDRDTSFTAAFDAVFRAAGARVVRCQMMSPTWTLSASGGAARAGGVIHEYRLVALGFGTHTRQASYTRW